MTPIMAIQALTSVSLPEASGCVVLPDCGRPQLRQWWKALGVTAVAEVGVWEGAFARTICEVTGAKVYAVDPWALQVGYLEVKNDATRLTKAFRRTQMALAPYSHEIIRKTSTEAAKTFADRSLDVVYIDGNHLRDHVLADLDAWLPKVKPGGVISGHDYKEYPTKPFIQVKDAIDDYTRSRGVSPWFVFAQDKSPSWAWVVA